MTTQGNSIRQMVERIETLQRKFGAHDAHKISVYLALALTARSHKDLRRRHAFLPGNMQLVQEDLVCLDRIFDILWSNDGPADDLGIQTVYRIMAGDTTGLTNYYLQLIDAGREGWARYEEFGRGDMILSHIERVGCGTDHFETALFGLRAQLSVVLSADHSLMRVRLWVRQSLLDQRCTHDLRTKMPMSTIGSRTFSTEGGWEVDWCYTVGAGDVESHVERQWSMIDGLRRREPGFLVMKDSFIPWLLGVVRDGIGVPIAYILPLLSPPTDDTGTPESAVE